MHCYRYIRLIRSKCKRSNVINRNIVSRYVIVNTRPDIYYKDSKVYPISHWIGTSESALFEQSLHDIRRVYRFRKRILVRVSTIRCIHIGVEEEEEKEERQTPLDLIYSENAFGMHSRTVLETWLEHGMAS